MQAVWTQIGTDKKKLILKKGSRRQQMQEILPSVQRVKEGFDSRAISAIIRRAVECSEETAQLARITCAFFGHACKNYFKILIGRFVTDV